VDVARLAPAQAYPFLQEWGRAMLRADVDDALEILLRAHDDYPDQRTAEGVGVLMKAVLARGRTAQARAILAEMQARTADRRYAGERPWFVQAAADYGDFLYSRGDYAAAAEAFAMASAKPRTDTGEQQVTDTEYWNAYQRANALFALGRVEESLALYDLVAASGASVARDARVRGDAARLEQRRRGGPAVAEAGV
jgi:tetratricopeptide (TPR) repeat protein